MLTSVKKNQLRILMKRLQIKKYIFSKIFFTICLLFFPYIGFALLPYEVKKDRFSFAVSYISLDYYQYVLKPSYILDNELQYYDSAAQGYGIGIGGLHFWGGSDFYILFPFSTKIESAEDGSNGNDIYNPGIETGFKYYPFAIAENSLRAFVGVAFSFPSYKKEKGTTSRQSIYPLSAGLTYTLFPFNIETGIKYSSNNDFDYIIDQQKFEIEVSDMSAFINIKYLTDTTIRSRSASKRDLPNGIHWYTGIGVSSAWLTTKSPYVEEQEDGYPSLYSRPFIYPEISAGFHWKATKKAGFRTIFNVSFRHFEKNLDGVNIDGVKSNVAYENNSLVTEIMQSFSDYNGFVPFLGISYSSNDLTYSEYIEDETINYTDKNNVAGVVAGWDIIPYHRTKWFLRTTLRYYDQIALQIDNKDLLFSNFELNFIQFVYQY